MDGTHPRPLEELAAEIAVLQSLKKTCGYQGNPLQPKMANTTFIFRKNERRTWGILGHISPCKDCKAYPFGIHLQTHESNHE